MSEPTPVQRRSWWKLFRLFCLFSAVVLSLLGWYATTDSFQQMVRRRVVAALEKATGGRVEIGQIHTIPFRLRVDVRDLVIHGREAADQAPYLRVDRVLVEVKIISLFSTEIGLHSLDVEHPVVHLIVYPDGSTNQPAPLVSQASGKAPAEELFSLSVSHVQVQQGELLWEEKRIPLDFDARSVALNLEYSFLHSQYEAHVVRGEREHQAFDSIRRMVWRADTALVLARDHADISSLNVASGKSEFHFSGHVQDFQHPQVTGDYHGAVDLGELAAAAKQPEFRKGTARVEGQWFLESGELFG